VHFLRVRIAQKDAEVVPIGENGAPLATSDPDGGTTAPTTVVTALA